MDTFTIKYKGNYIENLTEKQIEERSVRIYIPDSDNIVGGESIWGYLEPNNYSDTEINVKIILLNNSFCYFGFLSWGDEIQCKKKGDSYTLDVDWINNCMEAMRC